MVNSFHYIALKPASLMLHLFSLNGVVCLYCIYLVSRLFKVYSILKHQLKLILLLTIAYDFLTVLKHFACALGDSFKIDNCPQTLIIIACKCIILF